MDVQTKHLPQPERVTERQRVKEEKNASTNWWRKMRVSITACMVHNIGKCRFHLKYGQQKAPKKITHIFRKMLKQKHKTRNHILQYSNLYRWQWHVAIGIFVANSIAIECVRWVRRFRLQRECCVQHSQATRTASSHRSHFENDLWRRTAIWINTAAKRTKKNKNAATNNEKF